jgi:hypothetical protein
MSVTYYVALPFVRIEDGIAAGQGMSERAEANHKADAASRGPTNTGASQIDDSNNRVAVAQCLHVTKVDFDPISGR